MRHGCCWDFHHITTVPGGHREWPQKEKIPSEWQLSLGKPLVDDRGQRSGLSDWLETIERQQEVKKKPCWFQPSYSE